MSYATEKRENMRYRAHAVNERQIDEMIGIIKGIMCDDEASVSEIEFLKNWLEANKLTAHQWPASIIYARISDALADGTIDENERREITQLLSETIGHSAEPPPEAHSNSTSLPLCNPKPAVEFNDKTFCFTGKFYAGTRQWCENITQSKGGKSTSTITKKVDYLVIGELGNEAWIHSTHGRKIESAIELRELHGKLHIIDEQYWVNHLG